MDGAEYQPPLSWGTTLLIVAVIFSPMVAVILLVVLIGA